MTIHVSKDVANCINDAVRSGQFASPDEMIDKLVRDYAQRPQQQAARPPGKGAKPAPPKKPLTEAEVLQRMMDSGLITQLPDTDADFDDPDDQPITIEGEPLSETVIRERR